MRMRILLLLGTLCLFCVSAAAQKGEAIQVPITDETAQGGPFEIVTGRATLREALEGNQLRSSWGDELTLRNISDKPILLFKASLQLIGRHNRGRFRGPGDGPTYLLAEDRFFSTEILAGATLPLRNAPPGPDMLECCIGPSEHVSDARAEFRVLFVQFADGSQFGDAAEAKEDLEVREVIMTGLRQVVRSYERSGAGAFHAQANQSSPWLGTSVHSEVQRLYEQEGAEAAISRARQIVAIAEGHQAALASRR
jgi:hypothetical protein